MCGYVTALSVSLCPFLTACVRLCMLDLHYYTGN